LPGGEPVRSIEGEELGVDPGIGKSMKYKTMHRV